MQFIKFNLTFVSPNSIFISAEKSNLNEIKYNINIQPARNLPVVCFNQRWKGVGLLLRNCQLDNEENLKEFQPPPTFADKLYYLRCWYNIQNNSVYLTEKADIYVPTKYVIENFSLKHHESLRQNKERSQIPSSYLWKSNSRKSCNKERHKTTQVDDNCCRKKCICYKIYQHSWSRQPYKISTRCTQVLRQFFYALIR